MYPKNHNPRAIAGTGKPAWGGLMGSHVGETSPETIIAIGASSSSQKMNGLPEGAPKPSLYSDDEMSPKARRKAAAIHRKAHTYRMVGENAKLVSTAIGVAVISVLLGFYGAASHMMGSQELHLTHENAVEKVSQMMKDGLDLVERGEKSKELAQFAPNTAHPICNAQTVELLRDLRVTTQHQRVMFITDDTGRVTCSSTGGGHAPLVMPGGTQIRIGLNTYTFWREAMPIPKGQEGNMMVLAKGGVGTAYPANFSPGAIKGVTSIWFDKQKGGSALLDAQPGVSSTLMDKMSAMANTRRTHAKADFSMNKDAGYIISTYVPSVGLTIQSSVSWLSLLHEHKYSMLAWLLLSSMLGYAVTLLSYKKFSGYLSMHRRVDFLLTEENITCVYQPIVNMETGKAIGCEVLVRFKDGQQLLNPGEVIEAALARKLDWRLDKLIIRKAWEELYNHFGGLRPGSSQLISNVAFNVFPHNISVAKIAPLFVHLKSCIGDLPFAFNLEIIEHSYTAETVREIKMLHDQGFAFSIDDFGTGFSNLNSIKNLSPSTIKIDRCFVRDVQNHNLRANLIPEIVSIANAVEAKVIAEGIEEQAQAVELRKLGIKYGQGFYYAKPMPIDKFVQFIREHNSQGYKDVALPSAESKGKQQEGPALPDVVLA